MKQINFIPDAGTQKLYSCTIYVGVAQKTAKDNPIPVYLDNSLTQPIIIPLRGDVGQVYPAQYLVPLQISGAFNYSNVFIDASDYSIQVISDNGTIIFETVSVIDDTLQNASCRIFKSVSDISKDQSMDNGDLAFLSRFYNEENTNDSTGMLIYESKLPKSWHDGVLFFSPSVPYTDDEDYYNGTNETQPDGFGLWRMQTGRAPRSLTVNVPTQAPSMNIALELLKDIKPASDLKVVINLESGYQVSEEVKLLGVNLSHIVIASDHVIEIASDFSEKQLFYISDGAIAPLINATFDLKSKAGVSGVVVDYGSSCVLGAGKGVINSGDYAVKVSNSSSFSAYQADFSGSRNGVRVSKASRVSIDNCSLNDTVNTALNVTDVSNVSCNNVTMNECGIGLSVSSSLCDIRNATINNCRGRPISCYNSKVDASRLKVDHAESAITISDSSQISLAECALSTFTNTDAITLTGASQANLANMQLDTVKVNGVDVGQGSSVSLDGARIRDVDANGIFCYGASNLSAIGVTIENVKSYGIYGQSSTIEASNSILLNTGGIALDRAASANFRDMLLEGYSSLGLRSYMGSRACLRDAKIRKQKDGDPMDSDLFCREGSIITATNYDGGMNLTPNTLTAEGVIFK